MGGRFFQEADPLSRWGTGAYTEMIQFYKAPGFERFDF